MNKSYVYEIRVEGHLTERWSDWFEGLTIHNEPSGETVLSGPIVDQAALFGMLIKIQSLNLTLISVNRQPSQTLTNHKKETQMKQDKEMDKQVLVAYASKHGATAEIAEKIGQVLCQAGLRADVLSVDRVRDLARYHAVVLGSAVYIGQWQKDAAKFLQVHETLLAQRQVWLFSSGPTGRKDSEKSKNGWRLPESLQPIAIRIRPQDIAVFHGNLDLKKLNFVEKAMIKKVNALPGDFRDWNAITAWAVAIADMLKGDSR